MHVCVCALVGMNDYFSIFFLMLLRYLQMTFLAHENKSLVLKLQQTRKDPFVFTNCNIGNGEKPPFPENEVTKVSESGSKVGSSYYILK